MDNDLVKLLGGFFILLFLVGFICIKLVRNADKILEKIFRSKLFIIAFPLFLCIGGAVMFAHSLSEVLDGRYNWVSILFLFYPLALWSIFLEMREENQNFRQLSDKILQPFKSFLTPMKKVVIFVIKWSAIIMAVCFIGSKINENPLFLIAGLLAIVVYQLDIIIKILRK
jgi:hypothetical protein